MIGSLLYLTTSRPNIVCSVGLCARFQTNPKESHLTNVKRILRYLKITTDLCLWYPKGSNCNLVVYADANYAGFLVDRKSTSVSKVAANFENRFVGSIAGVETTKSGEIGAMVVWGDEPGSSVEETLADLQKKVTESYNPAS
ncbi:secreted RxLR effector protein 161-like [Nicotiana tabacum]|uniref:Secreted RxLR effector protein 161-like n=1 Tax=Nicotiana tabacum TaxID=4097 RepID=A0AC58STR6_TOBAC